MAKPDAEQRAVERFFETLWPCVLNVQPHEFYGDEIEDWLCGIAQALAALSPYLNAWIEAETQNARLNLARFIADTDFGNPNRNANAFWGERAELFAQVAAWVRSDVVKAKMSVIASEYPGYDYVERAFVSLP